MKHESGKGSRCRAMPRKALVLAIGSCFCLVCAEGALAQAVTGTIRGTVPVAPNESVRITSTAGFDRTVAVDSSGQYSMILPTGNYTVTLMRDGKPVQSRTNISPAASGTATVSFASAGGTTDNPKALSGVVVTASAVPSIDVTTTNQVTTITAAQLARLPLGNTAEAIAMLAPGVGMGAPSLGTGQLGNPLLSFGGASVAENAYFIDGMNTTDALTGQGGVPLPYGAIDQQQTMTSGYGAQYGRTIGGVINEIGKPGTNEWHFGFKAEWAPGQLTADPSNYYWNNPLYTANPAETAGNLNTYRAGNRSEENIYDAYVSGPLIKDKLTFFLGMERDDTTSSATSAMSEGLPYTAQTTEHQPKVYAKINWNINENNVLTVSALQNSNKVWSTDYNFNYDTLQSGSLLSKPFTSKTSYDMWVANYTSYITDDFTLHAMFGKTRARYQTIEEPYPGYDPTLPNIGSASLENPAFIPNGPISNTQTEGTISDSAHTSTEMNYRIDLEYKLGDHDLRAGIDNLQTWDHDEGSVNTGPGYGWSYGQSDANTPIVGSDPNLPPYVGAPDSYGGNPGGYYVTKSYNQLVASTRLTQQAQYIEDNWQVTPNLLLDLGLRNDQFVNHAADGQPFARLTKPQWAPRLGFSWDVHGDASLQIYGNAGRYYLALPAAVSWNATATANQASVYYTYSGIDPVTGEPTGLKLLPYNNGGRGDNAGVSSFNAYGQPVDAASAAATNIKAEYSDNFVLGMKQEFEMLGSKYVFSANGVYQDMGPDIIDDWDDTPAMCRAAVAQGLQYAGTTLDQRLASCSTVAPGFVLINPTQTNDLLIPDGNGNLHKVVITPQDQGFPREVVRRYYAVNLALEHPFDGTWYGSITYTWSRSWGNTEGPVDSYAGLSGGGGGKSVALTPQWDHWELMEYSYGPQPNSRTNTLKAYGFYQINPDWRVGGNLYIASGTPKVCLGYYGPGQSDPVDYGSAYHWCGGQPSSPGSLGSMPWIHTLDLNANYSPGWLQHKWNFNLAVFNVFNKQTPIQLVNQYGTTITPNPGYGLVQGMTPPRMVRFYVSYDF
ncbi:TonB-dependent receptor [Rhodanobacter sp. DHG33]|uniref:TonB-dependent receptor n=1 Tax=Rhodanobacter sp. DHG33 TaxID=2775921 RepID=UPI00177E3052|nr:TonB-dependent receptor [Rhodanobacter sp. DHG33]MBD8898246.1 TonB-dependent receptor [Rhodanobacter sp. DHG33]